VAEHSTELGYQIKKEDTKFLAKTWDYMDLSVKDAIEIKLRLNTEKMDSKLAKNGTPRPVY
jgi:hypothetical protein